MPLIGVLAQAQTPAPEGLDFGWLFLKTVAAMVLIIGLAILFIRYVMPRLQVGQLRSGKNIQIIERSGLEPKKGLYIIRVGSKLALVGTTEHAIGKIFDLEESDLKGGQS